MYRLPPIVLSLLAVIQLHAQSPHGESLKVDCASCHNPSGWTIISDTLRFDHSSTNFPLEGIHLQTDCKKCHSSLKFKGTPSDCATCHNDVHQMSVGNDCARCHTPESWLVENAPEMHEQAGFPLIGVHSTLHCADCHRSETNLRFDRIGNECINCHMADYLRTRNPDHAAGNISTNCIECHDPTTWGWGSETFNHDFFPLILGHDIKDCNRCHESGNFSDASPLCVSCHLNDFLTTANPNHTNAQFNTDCAQCHAISGWIPSSFDHNTVHPLLGAHAGIANDCNRCHSQGYTNTPNTCTGCHLNDYNATISPSHSAAGFPTDCALCHDETSWIPSSFDHNTVHPLLGAHAAIANDCIRCHSQGYTNTPNTCVGCHLNDYGATSNPNHSIAGFPTDCALCHDETSWVPSSFDHNTVHPLLGAHAGIANDCNRCHSQGYTNTPNTCVGCHLNDYNSTSIPNHSTAGFPTDCALCHDETSWTPSSFDHNSVHPLLGAHAGIANDCNRCHSQGYTNTPNTCVGCHLNDYNSTSNPNHSAAGFPTDCALCHSETTWIPSSFDHNTVHPLLGAHASIANDCNRCHSGGYTNTPNTCAGCHLTDYNSTTNPNHSTAGFSTNCAQCHSESSWTPASFDHDADFFPIYSGSHRGKWNQCTDCHIGGNYATFSCIDCHEHNNPNSVNNDHNGVSGYSYNSTACLNCHPDGRH